MNKINNTDVSKCPHLVRGIKARCDMATDLDRLLCEENPDCDYKRGVVKNPEPKEVSDLKVVVLDLIGTILSFVTILGIISLVCWGLYNMYLDYKQESGVRNAAIIKCANKNFDNEKSYKWCVKLEMHKKGY